MVMTDCVIQHLEPIAQLRRALHACPELAHREEKTQALLWDFLTQRTSLSLYREAGWFYAMHYEGDHLPTTVVRADLDAVKNSRGAAFHGCGHDGHSAIVAGLGLCLEGKQIGKNVLLLFQPAEEVGEGARPIAAWLAAHFEIAQVFGLHNIPGYAVGEVLLRSGCFACASKGVRIMVQGRQCHAAYPEQGANPAPVLSRLVLALPELIKQIVADQHLLMATVVQLQAGEPNYGLSASEGALSLTLRASQAEDLLLLQQKIEALARTQCCAAGLTGTFTYCDEFPDTQNPAAYSTVYRQALERAGLAVRELPEPMRWSEDFGWYLRQWPGLFFGIGAGENCPGLHTDAYEFPDEVLASAIRAFLALLA